MRSVSQVLRIGAALVLMAVLAVAVFQQSQYLPARVVPGAPEDTGDGAVAVEVDDFTLAQGYCGGLRDACESDCEDGPLAFQVECKQGCSEEEAVCIQDPPMEFIRSELDNRQRYEE